MDILVDRKNNEDGSLVFTITVTQPSQVEIGKNDEKILNILESCKESLSKLPPSRSDTQILIRNRIELCRKEVFAETTKKMKETIENQFRPRFIHICQEIYNWIYDAQQGRVQKLLTEFDPQRSRYYFESDNYPGKFSVPQQSEYDDEDEDTDWDDESEGDD